MSTVNQPTWRPTNKLMWAAAVGPAAAEVWSRVSTEYLPVLSGPAMETLAGATAAFLVGYFIKDRPNV